MSFFFFIFLDASPAMQLLLNHISLHQQSNTNSLTSTEYNNIKTLGECHEKLDINVVKETEWNQQSEFTRVTSTAYYSVVLAIVTLKHRHTNTKSQKYSNFNTTNNQLLRYDGLRLQVDGPSKKVWVVFVVLVAPSKHCKYDFISFTSCQWTST